MQRRMPFSPTGFLLDGAATMFGKPLMGAYNGWRQVMGYDQDPNAAPGYVTTDSIRKTGMDMAEGAVMGSAFTRAPAAALRSGVARPDTPPAVALDMSQDARLARAREQGFDTDTPVYHGTDKDFAAFDPDRSWGGQYWSTTDKASIEAGEVGAQGNGVIKKMFQRIKKPAGWDEYDRMGVDELIGRGYDGLALPHGKHMTYVAYEPNQYRDVNAAFDPSKINDPNLMSANPFTAAAPVMYAAPRPLYERFDPNLT